MRRSFFRQCGLAVKGLSGKPVFLGHLGSAVGLKHQLSIFEGDSFEESFGKLDILPEFLDFFRLELAGSVLEDKLEFGEVVGGEEQCALIECFGLLGISF